MVLVEKYSFDFIYVFLYVKFGCSIVLSLLYLIYSLLKLSLVKWKSVIKYELTIIQG